MFDGRLGVGLYYRLLSARRIFSPLVSSRHAFSLPRFSASIPPVKYTGLQYIER